MKLSEKFKLLEATARKEAESERNVTTRSCLEARASAFIEAMIHVEELEQMIEGSNLYMTTDNGVPLVDKDMLLLGIKRFF